jgi:predicted alpha/beta hydrolase
MLKVTLPALDGYSLGATYFEAQGQALGRTMLINAAMGIPQRYYAEYARFMAGQGFDVLTYDYRGIGDSKPAHLKGFAAQALQWGRDDQGGAVAWLRQQHPESKVVVLGHSLGGQLLGMLPDPSQIHALAGVAAQSGYWKLWQWPARARLALVWFGLIPTLSRLVGYFPGSRVGMGEDVPAQVAMQWAAACAQPHYWADYFAGDSANHYAQVKLPILAYSFPDDWYAPYKAVEGLAQLYPQADWQHQVIQSERPIGHFGYFRGKVAGSLWPAHADWLKAI